MSRDICMLIQFYSNNLVFIITQGDRSQARAGESERVNGSLCRRASHISHYSLDRPISQIPQCTSPLSHNAPPCNKDVRTCAHFCYKVVQCGIGDWCIVGFVRWTYRQCIVRPWGKYGMFYEYKIWSIVWLLYCVLYCVMRIFYTECSGL